MQANTQPAPKPQTLKSQLDRLQHLNISEHGGFHGEVNRDLTGFKSLFFNAPDLSSLTPSEKKAATKEESDLHNTIRRTETVLNIRGALVAEAAQDGASSSKVFGLAKKLAEQGVDLNKLSWKLGHGSTDKRSDNLTEEAAVANRLRMAQSSLKTIRAVYQEFSGKGKQMKPEVAQVFDKLIEGLRISLGSAKKAEMAIPTKIQLGQGGFLQHAPLKSQISELESILTRMEMGVSKREAEERGLTVEELSEQWAVHRGRVSEKLQELKVELYRLEAGVEAAKPEPIQTTSNTTRTTTTTAASSAQNPVPSGPSTPRGGISNAQVQQKLMDLRKQEAVLLESMKMSKGQGVDLSIPKLRLENIEAQIRQLTPRLTNNLSFEERLAIDAKREREVRSALIERQIEEAQGILDMRENELATARKALSDLQSEYASANPAVSQEEVKFRSRRLDAASRAVSESEEKKDRAQERLDGLTKKRASGDV